jgi:SAM-dependent methyltransferase/8-oxo-dGTP pyrophosphatase MutT (NUDIX family)
MADPRSCKAVLVAEGRVLLLRNGRGEWELPGGRPDPGEAPAAAVRREVREEAGLDVSVGQLLAQWRYEVLPGRFVLVAAFACALEHAGEPVLSAEHDAAGWFNAAELGELALADGYRAVAADWLERSSRGRRAIFDEDPELYDRARPGYPPQAFDDLAALGELRPGSRVLEVGSGTGKATVALAERGYRVVGLELGAGMARVARERLAGFDGVESVDADFEQWPLPSEPFDAVVSATAWHWIDPAVGVPKAAEALRPGGVLATLTTTSVRGADVPFLAEWRACYERWMPSTPPDFELPAAADIPHVASDLDGSDAFAAPDFRRYEWTQDYATAPYLELLRTYSNHRALDERARSSLLGCVGELIDSHGGRVVISYLTELRVARRRPTPRPSGAADA